MAEDVFKLQHLLDCKLLKVRDDMEELTSSAVKEEQIEVKLATVSLDWAEQNLVFADYKTRGTVILKVRDMTTMPFICFLCYIVHSSPAGDGRAVWHGVRRLCPTVPCLRKLPPII